MSIVTRLLCGAVVACLALVAADASAQQTIKLTVAAGSPVTVTPAKMTKEVFIPEINKALAASKLNIKIEWTEGYNQTIAKFTEVFEAVEEGVAHVGVLLKNFEESKLPLEQYASAIPFGIADADTFLKVDQRIRAKVPEMDAHFTRYNQVVLAHAAGDSQQMFTKFPVAKLEDLKGHKIGGSGALGLPIRGTDAVLVNASMAASYTDISNGVYQGYLINEILAFPYKTYQAAPYFTKVDFGASGVPALSVNKKTWDGFPTPLKDIFHQAAQKWVAGYKDWESLKTKEAREAMTKEGMKSHVLVQAEREKWAKKMPNIAKEWADATEKQGLPARRILTAFMDEVRAQGKPMREWDKEIGKRPHPEPVEGGGHLMLRQAQHEALNFKGDFEMTIALRILASGAAMAAALVAADASAQQTIKLTVVAGSPITVTPAKMTKEVFIPEINKRLAASGNKYKIEWTEGYNQTIAKVNEVFEAVEEGVAHVGVLLKNFEDAKLPLEQYASAIPFGISDPRKMIDVDNRIRAKVPEMDAHFTKYNQVVLVHASGEGMQMFTKFPLTKVDDLKGKKIGGSGALGLPMRGTEGVLVNASMMQSYTDISNGVYDGYIINESLAQPYKTYQPAPYFTKTDFGCSNVGALSVNKKTWDGLPIPVKTIFHEAAQRWLEEYTKWEDEKLIEARAILAKEGVKSSVLPAAERVKWAKQMPNIAKEWVDAVEKQGLPAKRILTAYMDEVRAAGVAVREWDKE